MAKDKNFAKGNFSVSLEVDLPKKEDFVKQWAGKFNGDIETLYNDLKKAKGSYDRANKKPSKSKDESGDDK